MAITHSLGRADPIAGRAGAGAERRRRPAGGGFGASLDEAARRRSSESAGDANAAVGQHDSTAPATSTTR